MRGHFARSLLNHASTRKDLVLLAGDLGYGVLDEFSDSLPEQYFNLGITEQASISLAAGMAWTGLRPFYYSIANFPIYRCLEQIRNDVNAMKLPVTIVAVGAGLGYGKAGYSHYAVEDIAAMRTFSNIEIYNPSDLNELNLSISKILNSNMPAYLRIGGRISDADSPSLESISSNNPGIDIIYTGDLKNIIRDAIQLLEMSGISVGVKSLYSLNLTELDEYLSKLSRPIITIEEHVLAGGVGSLVLERLNLIGSSLPVKRIGIGKINPDVVGTQNFLRDYYGITVGRIVQESNNLLKAGR